MPREVIRFALTRKGVPEYLINGIMSLYKGCKTAVSVDGELSSSFSVKVRVQQGSALSPLLLIMVMDVLTEDVRDGSFSNQRDCKVSRAMQMCYSSRFKDTRT